MTGGPTVNQLMLQADKVKKDLDAIEAKRKRNALAALTRAKNNDEETGYLPGGGYVPYVPASIEDDTEGVHGGDRRIEQTLVPVWQEDGVEDGQLILMAPVESAVVSHDDDDGR